MKRHLSKVGLLLATGLAVALLASSRPAAGDPQPNCIAVWGEARYRPYGFDHVVHIASACTVDVRCLVSTDVDPEPIRVTVAAWTHIELATRLGSPSREFTPVVSCRFPEP
jgi:hypothetical protein